MHSLQESLQDSYLRHPDFPSADSVLNVDLELLVRFEQMYASTQQGRLRLSKGQYELHKNQCVAALSEIFQELLSQVSEKYEQLFLEELHRACATLLAEEFGFLDARSHGSGLAARSQGGEAGARRLDEQRYYFGRLPFEAIDEILSVAASDIESFREKATVGRLTRGDLSINAGTVVGKIVRILNREFGKLGVLEAVSTYMATRMSVTGLAVELSVPQSRWWANSFAGLARAPSTLYAHLDESRVYPKSIVYLSDVTEANGPTSCYLGVYDDLKLSALQQLVGRVLANVGNGDESPLKDYYNKRYHQSMTSERFRRHFMRLPVSMRFNSHFGWDIFPDSEAEKSLVEREQFMIGPAGTFMVFDGAKLLHRGGLMQHGERIALQVVFSNIRLEDRIRRRLRKLFA
jgi:hypothetical protein